MHRWLRANFRAVGVAFAFAARAQSAPAQAPAATARYEAVVERGKPMQLVRVGASNSTAAAEPAPEPCLLERTPPRRTTPSSECTTCHDGGRAVDARTGHKFDIEYQSNGDLRPDPQAFNPKIVLVENRVACMSCHDPASQLPLHLAAPTSGDVAQRLCVACHVR